MSVSHEKVALNKVSWMTQLDFPFMCSSSERTSFYISTRDFCPDFNSGCFPILHANICSESLYTPRLLRRWFRWHQHAFYAGICLPLSKRQNFTLVLLTSGDCAKGRRSGVYSCSSQLDTPETWQLRPRCVFVHACTCVFTGATWASR